MNTMIFKLITVGEKKETKHEYKFNRTIEWICKRDNP